MQAIVIRSNFGHEILATQFAKATGANVLIIPNKADKAEYEAEAAKIYSFMSVFYDNMEIVPFEEINNVVYRDIIAELKAGVLDDKEWNVFFSTRLTPDFPDNLPVYHMGQDAVLMVPQKLLSDGECGITAAQQSLNPSVFGFLKNEGLSLVLGQHFHKVNDLDTVKHLAEEFQMYVPGLTENEQVLGIRGVKHEEYLNMYTQLKASVGIAGTHTWLMLTCFPEIPQIILYNRNGVENWEAIAEAARRANRVVYAIGFSDDTDMNELSEHIQATWKCLVG